MALVEVSRDGHVATVALNRPDQRNAISIEMLGLLTDALHELSDERDARVVLLTGEGDHFCAGADFADLTIMQPPDRDYGRSFEAGINAITSCSIPVIAKVQGAALGAGCQLLVACDMAVAADDAVIGIPAAKLGLLISYENVERLVLSVGPKRAADVMYTGRTLSGQEAAAWGLVNESVPRHRLDARARELADAVAEAAPLTVKGSKEGIRVALSKLAVDREAEPERVAAFDEMAARAFTSDDLKEGVQAFRERRPPRFTGT